MDDLISRRMAIDALCDNCDNVQAVCAHYPCKQYIAIEKLLSVQPERKTGKWVLNLQGNWACSICGNDPYHNNMKNMNFCPNCGAEMNRGDDDADT